jgi:hypothetical protein
MSLVSLGGGTGGGFFGSGGKQSTTNSETRVNNASLGNEGDNSLLLNSNVTLGNFTSTGKNSNTNVNLNLTQTDYGALEAAHALGTEALQMGSQALGDVLEFSGRGLDNVLEANRGALAFGETAISSNEKVARDALIGYQDLASDSLHQIGTFGRDSLDSVTKFGNDSLSAVLDASAGVLDFAKGIFSDALSANQTLTKNNLEGLTSLAQQTSESADDRVTRTAGYAFAAIGVVMLVVLWKRT